MNKKALSKGSAPPEPVDQFEAMPSVRLAMLASLMWQHGELLYERLFNLRTIECRVIGAVAAHQPLSLRRCCTELDIDKSLGSRLVAKLVDAGLLERRADPEDQRSFYLLLSPAGKAMHGRILAAATERNRSWTEGMDKAEAAAFAATMDKQMLRAKQMLALEKQQQGQAAPEAVTAEVGEAAERSNETSPLLVDRQALLDLHKQLAALLAANGVQLPEG